MLGKGDCPVVERLVGINEIHHTGKKRIAQARIFGFWVGANKYWVNEIAKSPGRGTGCGGKHGPETANLSSAATRARQMDQSAVLPGTGSDGDARSLPADTIRAPSEPVPLPC